MIIKRLIKILLILIFLFLPKITFAESKKLIDDITYNTNQKIEILEFFSYNCKHCFLLDKQLKQSQFNYHKNISFLKIPLSFNSGMKILQQLFFTINILDREDLHQEIFKAIHQHGIKLHSKKEIDKWIEKYKINQIEFNNVFYSDDVFTKIDASNFIIKSYKINYLPVFIINRKLITLPDTHDNIISHILSKINNIILSNS